MKKIQINNLENIRGGNLNGRSCLLLGGLAALGLGGMVWAVAGATVAAVAGGCFNYIVNPSDPEAGQP